MKTAAEKATQGEWWADEVKNEGCYGSGDDCVEGFTSYAIYGSDGQTLFDSLNSDAACICEEYDGEGHVAWDETAQRNAEFIALANPANVLALVEALEKAQRANEYLREQSAEWERKAISNFEDCAELSARVEELESQRKLAFTASNRWADKFREAEKRIAELENNEIQEEGNQFLVVRHPGKVPVIKHPVGELEDYLRQIFKADPLATIDIVTHRYYGVGGQFVEDADEYLHEMSINVEAE
ncbi:ead/Ea22-like family protein [Klebsiella quasipneumoniae]|uniref:ead/Ea22-like family protein n=1 Tax=Klebsiella quasipneumoniae TaxID=1463165 RepID=UPI0019D29000|nr:ead/Ea22-like family protein [Klebsiella quasipneumoniae]